MNGQALLDLTTDLLGGEELNETFFLTLLNMARVKREGNRDWTWLRRKDTSISWLTSDTPATAKAVPSDFLRPIKGTLNSRPIVFLRADGRKWGTADEVALERQYDYQDAQGYFFVDHGADPKTIHFTTAAPENLTAALFYVSSGPDIGLATEWARIPARYHPLLAYDVSIMYKGDVDFDDINARMARSSAGSAEALESAMVMEDERSKLSALGV